MIKGGCKTAALERRAFGTSRRDHGARRNQISLISGLPLDDISEGFDRGETNLRPNALEPPSVGRSPGAGKAKRRRGNSHRKAKLKERFRRMVDGNQIRWTMNTTNLKNIGSENPTSQRTGLNAGPSDIHREIRGQAANENTESGVVRAARNQKQITPASPGTMQPRGNENDSAEVTETKGAVLLVGRDPDALDRLSGMLGVSGHSVRLACDATSALESVLTARADVALIEIGMMKESGYDICRQLKSFEEAWETPVLFFGVGGEAVDGAAAYSAGGAGYLTQPFREEEILACVGFHIRAKRRLDMLKRRVRTLDARNHAKEKALGRPCTT